MIKMQTYLIAQLLNLVFALANGQQINVDQANAVVAQAQFEVSNGCTQYCDMPIKVAGEIVVPTTTVEVKDERVFIPVPVLPTITGYAESIGQ